LWWGRSTPVVAARRRRCATSAVRHCQVSNSRIKPPRLLGRAIQEGHDMARIVGQSAEEQKRGIALHQTQVALKRSCARPSIAASRPSCSPYIRSEPVMARAARLPSTRCHYCAGSHWPLTLPIPLPAAQFQQNASGRDCNCVREKTGSI